MYEKLIKNIIENSLKNDVKDKKIFITMHGRQGAGFSYQISEEIARRGGIPLVDLFDDRAIAAFLSNATDKQIESFVSEYERKYKDGKGFVRILCEDDLYAMSIVPAEKRNRFKKLYGLKVRDAIMLKNDWVLFNLPTLAYSNVAGMSNKDYAALWQKAVSLDYRKMLDSMRPLKELMEKTDRVKITGPGTDVEFSIKGIPAVPCAGECNIPDGEVFTAPVKDSINGAVQFNTPLVYNGMRFENIRLEFKDGRIVKFSSAQNQEDLAKIIDMDEGSRYMGEFALGVNPAIVHTTGEILFDEKIGGSFHMALGNCYEAEAPNGNTSANHFDMVCIQTPEHGGGQIAFDGKIIRKDGLFVLPELEGLNPDNLLKEK